MDLLGVYNHMAYHLSISGERDDCNVNIQMSPEKINFTLGDGHTRVAWSDRFGQYKPLQLTFSSSTVQAVSLERLFNIAAGLIIVRDDGIQKDLLDTFHGREFQGGHCFAASFDSRDTVVIDSVHKNHVYFKLTARLLTNGKFMFTVENFNVLLHIVSLHMGAAIGIANNLTTLTREQVLADEAAEIRLFYPDHADARALCIALENCGFTGGRCEVDMECDETTINRIKVIGMVKRGLYSEIILVRKITGWIHVNGRNVRVNFMPSASVDRVALDLAELATQVVNEEAEAILAH